MSKTKRIVKNDGPLEGLLGPRRIPYRRGEPVEVASELADAVLSQEGSGWKAAKGPRPKKEDS